MLKAICIKKVDDRFFDITMEVGEINDYGRSIFNEYILNVYHKNENLGWACLKRDRFEEYFMDIVEFRNNKINDILND